MQTGLLPGFSLIEMLIGIGLLAVSIPLVLGTLAKSGESGMASRMENRCALIIPACFQEIWAAREGRENLLTGLEPVFNFPIDEEFACLGFGRGGEPVLKIESADYEAGLGQADSKGIQYLASIEAQSNPKITASSIARRLKISVEYPATAPAEKRKKLHFYTEIP